jgi:hypothetical protein
MAAGSSSTLSYLPAKQPLRVGGDIKATNDYGHKTVLAYLATRFSIPEIRGYFESRGVDVHEDLYALSEMVQWLWRSAIRDDREPRDVHVYVPRNACESCSSSG